MKGLLVDCKVAVRHYLRTPVSSLIAVVVLAVGTAFVGAFLSLYVDLALEPVHGVEAGDRVVTIAPVQGYTVPFELTERMSEELRSLEAIVAVTASSFPVQRDGRSATLELASRGFFDRIRPKLALGRGAARRDDRSAASRDRDVVCRAP